MSDIAAPVTAPVDAPKGPLTYDEAFQSAPSDASGMDALLPTVETEATATEAHVGVTAVKKVIKLPTVMPPDPKPFANYHGGGASLTSGRLSTKSGYSVRNTPTE